MSTATIRTYSPDQNNVETKREYILQTAVRMFVRKGYHVTTTRQLTAACGMSVGGLYYYVGSKEDILHLIARRLVYLVTRTTEKLVTELAGSSPTDAFQKSMEAYYNLVDRNRDFWLFTNTESKVFNKDDRELLYEVHRQKVQYFENLLKRGIRAGEFRVKYPALLAHDITILFPAWVTRYWFLKGVYKSVGEYSKQQTELIFDGIRVKTHLAQGENFKKAVGKRIKQDA